jgi:hypothetical protein
VDFDLLSDIIILMEIRKLVHMSLLRLLPGVILTSMDHIMSLYKQEGLTSSENRIGGKIFR